MFFRFAPLLFLAFSAAGSAEPEIKPGYSNDSEVGITKTTGNSITDSYSFLQISTYQFSSDLIQFGGHYFESSAEDVNTHETSDTAFHWDLNFRYGHKFNNGSAPFVADKLESNVFSGFIHRQNVDVGDRIQLRNSNGYVIFSEVGYRYTDQNNVDGTRDYSHNARLYIEGNYQISKSGKAKLWLEYIPRLDRSSCWKLNGEAALESAINSKFSLKLSYLWNRETPPVAGKLPLDTTFTTAVVAKF